MSATVTDTPYVLLEEVLEILHSLRGQHRTGRTDDADLVLARLVAKRLWASGWRRNLRPHPPENGDAA